MIQALLPRDALRGLRVGISVSESKDLLRLGLVEQHFRLALGEITRCLLIAGGKLAYGGHLQPTGYTALITCELERYCRRDRPLLVCLSYIEHRRMTLSDLAQKRKALGLYGEIVCLDASGNVMAPERGRTEEAQPVESAELRAQALTSFRHYMIDNTHGRVFLGGKRADFTGAMPGLLEEAILAFEKRHPVYLAGGFGGITWDIARVLGVDHGDWFAVLPNAPRPDPRVTQGLQRLRAVAEQTNFASLQNGLSAEENRRLAATHRPSEIAALLSIGLGRRLARGET